MPTGCLRGRSRWGSQGSSGRERRRAMIGTLRGIRRNSSAALLVILLLGGTAVGWSTYAPLEGAVVAPGLVVVESNLRKVQHPTGGIVGALNVREGQKVEAGEVVLRLDDTTTRVNLAIVL